ncbi:hypothetical protein TGAM01_v205884 [Trichoderma gamsii]|uniref:Uncharacterized protein n=1 Tax=Trichoderma gamsii TaxID=398673 RepID=A0A2P4ZLM9_9HYPO|nr:hypothetical protein TGAM01_v205884 [Trichoderma gamsii]PON25198.1 hypothetical protein TGAM01_v205884 [Trichoderma gamsii]
MGSSVSDSAELAFLKDCKVSLHTTHKKDVADGDSFTTADLNEPNFNIFGIDKAVENDNEVKTYNDDQTDFNPSKLRWFHIPANNMAWIDIFMGRWFQTAGGLDNKLGANVGA